MDKIRFLGYQFYKHIIVRFRGKEVKDQDSRVWRYLQKVHAKRNVQEEWIAWQSEVYGLLIIGISVFLLLGLLLKLTGSGMVPLSDLSFTRPSYDETSKSYHLVAEDSEGNQQDINLELEPVLISREEAEGLFQEYAQILQKKVLGENESLDHIRTDLDFSEEEDWSFITASWRSSDSDLIDDEGKVHLIEAQDGSTDITLYLSMTFENYAKEYKIPAAVVRYETDSQGPIGDYLSRKEKEERLSGTFTLPEEYEGQKLVYKENHDGQRTTGLLFLAAVFFFFIIYRKYYTLRTAGEQRDKQLERDYPDLIAKLLILVRAGMPVKSAWIHMTEDYRKNKKKDGVVHYAYEEMIGSVKLMESGVGEGKAYTEFGRRCGGHMYLKLGSLLEQNIKKGSTGMAQVLDGERVQALENRRRQIRSSGEAAGTQLMMPMMIMFILVMAIIMVPALSSF